ncbi:MAG: 3-oxoacyl-[acyl-carrier-protein] reductase FabG [Burkholderiaceae bacterium]|nr:3-oxoacyl-[acyl-carrier-protein] reductase FabG [Burkholderiaceae bacterium]
MTERRLVLVTGAARRIGRAIALDLAAHGWNVAVHYRRSQADALDTVAALRAAGAQAEAFAADLADEAQCEALLPEVVQRMGRVAALVNNASLFEHDDVTSLRYDTLARHWLSNAAPAIVLARALHGHRTQGGWDGVDGCVVNLLDEKLFNPNPDHLSYTLSKAALHAATPLLARALAPALRVCGVAPGLTLESPQIDPQRLAALKQQGPLGHGVEARDVAHAVRFVLENPAITGSTVLVDAGSHLQPRARDFAFTDSKIPAP